VVGAGDANGERFLRVTVGKGRTEWRERFNHDVGTYFSSMYRGLEQLMGSKVDWRVPKMGSGNLPDPLFKYREYFQAERAVKRAKPIKPSVSLSRNALQIKFEVALIERVGSNETIIDKTQLFWNYRPDSIGLSMVEDMLRLQDKGSINATEVSRRLVSKKGGVQSVSLLDTGTLEATFSRNAGSLVPPVTRLKVMSKDIRRRIDELATEGLLSSEQKKELRDAWATFDADYVKALDDFISVGLHGESVLKQADSFAAFLRALSTHARGDIFRARLVSEVLTIGTVKVLGEQPCLIIPPWHPERMKALAVKTRRVAGLVTHILSDDKVQFGDRGIFFRDFSEELAHPFYPEIAVTMRGGHPSWCQRAAPATVSVFSKSRFEVTTSQ
jgi:S-DNA-T family DNA segregation ATPase FtsK/SpoIIIE